MSDWQLKTPVCLLIFKRPDTTERVFEVIRQVKPSKLLVVADGPHSERPDEIEKCAAARAIIERVDWECEVLKNYASVNMGCRRRVSSGLDWVFNIVEEAIVLEDDCLPHPTFFRFCEELLEYYRYHERIMMISGNNFQFGHRWTEDSYYFSLFSHIWGWATWRRAWQHYDDEMKLWQQLRDSQWLKNFWQDKYALKYWSTFFQYAYEGQTAWDYAWLFACWVQKGLSILPEVNLVTNIGFNLDATGDITRVHPTFLSLFANVPIAQIEFPIRHPQENIPNIEADNFTQAILFNLNWVNLRQKIVDYWLELKDKNLESTYLQLNISKILNSKLRDELMINTEEKFLNELSQHISRGFDEPKAIQCLLAAMLYSYPHQLPLQFDLTCIPSWLINDYLKYMLTPPILFKEKEEADSYYQYLQKWIEYLHRNIFSNKEVKLWQNIAIFFTYNTNFIPIYFNTKNLKDVYKKRADIMETSLKTQGYQIDYKFPDRSLERKKIRLGVLAAHFEPQTETFTTLPVYKHLNRDLFEIILYTTSLSNHRLERYCYGHADALVQLPQDLQSQVQTIRDGGLDIILIATNVTAVTNPITLLALHRLARVQVASTSSCVTTGMRHVDYYISGRLTEPTDNAQAHYTEKLITVEGPAHCHDFATEEQLVSTIHVSRESLGIEPNEIVYISGANFYKIIPEVETAWAKIIATVPNSKLVLYPFNPNWSSSYPINYLKKRIVATFSNYGLSEDRLLILEPVPNRADIKERLKVADVYLDSYPFSGINSLLDPLEIGLPTAVMNGNSFRSLMGASLLQELQIPDLIADSEQAYIQLAIALGTNSELRQQKSDQIKQAMQANPRFLDSRAYSTQMGQIFQELFCKYQAEALTEHFKLRENNIIIFPDWSQPEELLYQDLASAIAILGNHPDRSQTTLLIDRGNLTEDEATLFVSGVVMNLVIEEDLDVADELEISLVGQLSEIQWKALLPRIQARIVLENEDKKAIALAKAETISYYDDLASNLN